jgi:Protein of unknown function (DUF2695)
MDRERKKELKRAANAEIQSGFLGGMPMCLDQVIALIEHTGNQLHSRDPRLSPACDHTLSISRAWCIENGADVDRVLGWLCDNGGGCDCEVIFNVDSRLEEALEWRSKQ